MGTERFTEYEGKCICGHGIYHVDNCSPDHSWPTSTPQWYESQIDCRHCHALYEIERRGKKFVLVERSKLKHREALRHEAYVRSEALMAVPSVQSALSALENLLKSQRSVAATCRVLKADSLTHYSEAEFRKHWSSPSSWVKGNIRADELPRVLALVKMAPAEVIQELSEIAALTKAASVSIEPYGPPIYELP
nr:hypothetical protein [Desulfobacula sp.]